MKATVGKALLLLWAMAMGAIGFGSDQAQADALKDGMVLYEDLRRATGGPCAGAFIFRTDTDCPEGTYVTTPLVQLAYPPYEARDIGRAIALVGESGGYKLTGDGDIQPFGAAPPMIDPGTEVRSRTSPMGFRFGGDPNWGWDIGRDIVLMPGGAGGYVLDGWGGIHAFGAAPIPKVGPYWPGSDLARALVLIPGTVAGYVLDGKGQLWPWTASDGGLPPTPSVRPSYPSDLARDMTIQPGGSSGYIVDGYGGIRPWATRPELVPPGVTTSHSWDGWDIINGISARPDGLSGYVLDGWGGVHPWAADGRAMPPRLRTGPYWPGWDIARDFELGPTGAAAQLLDGFGHIHVYGIEEISAPGDAAGLIGASTTNDANGEFVGISAMGQASGSAIAISGDHKTLSIAGNEPGCLNDPLVCNNFPDPPAEALDSPPMPSYGCPSDCNGNELVVVPTQEPPLEELQGTQGQILGQVPQPPSQPDHLRPIGERERTPSTTDYPYGSIAHVIIRHEEETRGGERARDSGSRRTP